MAISEIEKLRQRLTNVNRNTVEYRMTVAEAKKLLAEIDSLKVPIIVVEEEKKTLPPMQAKIMDGGTF